MKRFAMRCAVVLAVAQVGGCSSGRAGPVEFLPMPERYSGFKVESATDSRGLTCLKLRVQGKVEEGCQSPGIQPYVTPIVSGNVALADDGAPGGNVYGLYAVDLNQSVFAFEDLSDSGSVATTGPGYLLVFTPGLAAYDADWQVVVRRADGVDIKCKKINGPLECYSPG